MVVPIGGGGLISGVAYAIKQPEPQGKGLSACKLPVSASMHDRQPGRKAPPSPWTKSDTFADGIAVKHPGDLTYRSSVSSMWTVSSPSRDDEIAAAILALLGKTKGHRRRGRGCGAVSRSAAAANSLSRGKKVVCLRRRGNIDVNILSRVITRGLVTSGRNTTLTIALADKPGQLQEVSEIIARCGANVVSVHHDRGDVNMAINSCFLKLGLETRDKAQIEQIKEELTRAGFHLVSERV